MQKIENIYDELNSLTVTERHLEFLDKYIVDYQRVNMIIEIEHGFYPPISYLLFNMPEYSMSCLGYSVEAAIYEAVHRIILRHSELRDMLRNVIIESVGISNIWFRVKINNLIEKHKNSKESKEEKQRRINNMVK